MTAYTGQEQIERRIRKLLQGIYLILVEFVGRVSDDLGSAVDRSDGNLDRSCVLSIV